MSKEEWRQVVGFENYEVSYCGEIRNANTNHLLKSYFDKGGYERVSLYKDGKPQHFFVHQLVAKAFIPNPENKSCIDHIDTVRTNNTVSNLRWVSRKENSNNELSRQNYSNAKTDWWKYESRRKWMSESKKGKNNPNFGKKEPKEITEKRIRQRMKKIYQYTLDGEFIAEYNSVKEAAEVNGYDSSNLSRAACNGKIRYGYKWEYEKLQ